MKFKEENLVIEGVMLSNGMFRVSGLYRDEGIDIVHSMDLFCRSEKKFVPYDVLTAAETVIKYNVKKAVKRH